MQYPYRRVVTGVDQAGISRVLFDDSSGKEAGSDAVSTVLLWQTNTVPVDNSDPDDTATTAFSFDFSRGATKLIIVEIQPTEGLMPPGMHAANTLDYLVITAGKLSLYLEEGEVEIAPGDIVVNRGNVHAWRNKGPEVARMVVVNVDAAPVGAGATV
jgi:mannose-6-phosphate isomerase-like protein (cupin superfamily)